jgi:hypothetical protein
VKRKLPAMWSFGGLHPIDSDRKVVTRMTIFELKACKLQSMKVEVSLNQPQKIKSEEEESKDQEQVVAVTHGQEKHKKK